MEGPPRNEAENSTSTDNQTLSFGRRLRRQRLWALGWSQERLAQQIEMIGGRYGGTAKVTSLKIMICKWENGEKIPDQRNRRLLAEALSVEVAHLGLTIDPNFRWPPRDAAAGERTKT